MINLCHNCQTLKRPTKGLKSQNTVVLKSLVTAFRTPCCYLVWVDVPWWLLYHQFTHSLYMFLVKSVRLLILMRKKAFNLLLFKQDNFTKNFFQDSCECSAQRRNSMTSRTAFLKLVLTKRRKACVTTIGSLAIVLSLTTVWTKKIEPSVVSLKTVC